MQVTLGRNIITPLRRWTLGLMHCAVLIASVIMVCWITRDTIESISFLTSPRYMRFQFWTCLLFLTDILLEWLFSEHKWRYVVANFFFILISIPWLNIVDRFGIELSPTMAYLIKFVPMIRAGYVLALISGTLSANRALSMMTVYIIWALASVYFAALVFFVEEHYVNPLVESYWSALWWASLSITTVGCEIEPITATGRFLAVILSGEGLILFPVFTVYVTRAVLGAQKFSDITDPDSDSDSDSDSGGGAASVHAASAPVAADSTPGRAQPSEKSDT